MLGSQVPIAGQHSSESPASKAAEMPDSLRGGTGRNQMGEAPARQDIPEQNGESGTSSLQPSASDGTDSAGQASKSRPQSAHYRGNGEVVSYPLAESPEQSGPGRPARAGISDTPQGRDGQAWAGRAAMPDSSSGEEHPGGHAARSRETHGTQSSEQADVQPGSREAGQKGDLGVEDSAQSSSNEARGSSSILWAACSAC